MSSSRPLRPQTILEKRYGVIRLLAEGATTRVYEGRHVGLSLPLVIKQLKELYPDPAQAKEQVAQFQVEARILARLRHPNLVLVYDTFVVDELPVLVVEMVSGKNLEEIAKLAPKQISENRVLVWADQLLDSLHYLHTQDPPVIVRGLQPSNIVLDDKGVLRLVDFGLAKSMDDKGSGTRNIVRGLGEDGFAPLEQGAYSKTDARSDLYSLGAVLYFLLTKEVPPSASQRVISTNDPLKDPREKNPTISGRTWTAIQKMMALRPNERPDSAWDARQLFNFSTNETETESLGRNCVDCEIPLQTENLDNVEIDRCAQCGGLWLDEGELETLREVVEEQERQAEELVRTLALSPDHPALRALDDETQRLEKRPFWSALTRLLGLPN